jgi:hypothetical protein
VKVTVLPIQRFALMKSYVFIDVVKSIYIKGKRVAPTNTELIKRIIYEEFLGIALGVVTCKSIEWNSLLQWRIHI